MTQVYSDPTRTDDPHALPDCEVFYLSGAEDWYHDDEDRPLEQGWYWWSCFPGCIPDSEAFGPFDTEAEALADAQNE